MIYITGKSCKSVQLTKLLMVTLAFTSSGDEMQLACLEVCLIVQALTLVNDWQCSLMDWAVSFKSLDGNVQHCRYYAAPERLTAFLQSVTAQLIGCCRGFLSAAGKLWDQDKPSLIANLTAAVHLRDAYVEAYRCRTPLMPQNISYARICVMGCIGLEQICVQIICVTVYLTH